MLIQNSVEIWLVVHNQSRMLQADWLILENNEKASLNVNMSYCKLLYMMFRTTYMQMTWRTRFNMSLGLQLVPMLKVWENLAQVRKDENKAFLLGQKWKSKMLSHNHKQSNTNLTLWKINRALETIEIRMACANIWLEVVAKLKTWIHIATRHESYLINI